MYVMMSEGTVIVVPLDLGVQDSLRGFLDRNFSKQSGLKSGEVEKM